MRTESHADGHFLRAQIRRERDDTIGSKASQQHRRHGEGGNERRVEATRRFTVVDRVLHALNLGQRQLGIKGANRSAESTGNLVGLHPSPHYDETSVTRRRIRRRSQRTEGLFELFHRLIALFLGRNVG